MGGHLTRHKVNTLFEQESAPHALKQAKEYFPRFFDDVLMPAHYARPVSFKEDAHHRLSEIVSDLYPLAEPRDNKYGGTDYYVGDQFLCGLRGEGDELELYLMALYTSKKIEFDFAERLAAWHTGKSCLAFNEKNPMDWGVVREVLVESM
jgi:hypothetical protein